MFTTTGSRGMYKAPLSKSLLLVPTALTVLLMLLQPQYQSLFEYNLQAVREDHQIWRLVYGRLIWLDLKDTFCSGLLIYNFRVLERRFGSRKFASFLLGTWIVCAAMDLLLAETLHFLFELQVEMLPAGLLGPVFALFVPFFCSIPRVPVTQLLGQISITNKSLVYIMGLQLLTSSYFMWVVALSGLLSGVLYRSNLLWMQRLLLVPAWLSRVGSLLLEPLLSGSEPTQEAPMGMGATLDIQRQQRMDMLDQQMLLSQLAQVRRNAQPPQAGLLNWNRFFPTLRQRGRNAAPAPAAAAPQARRPGPSPPPENTPVTEEQVARLMEMGFSRVDAQEALRASNNDINMATNFLLQH
ncbi:ubiquitin-associated domain-containing protein 2 [Clupea harengus]|uniref:Ubiquitin-associated domain-containing protein 2 n=1 Tax=Clupea harengus TaxID=7950 RepID=A0A6P8EUP4_CLUHA|nr:ubiquitin-associated domain-containing protein 2 [Clupea harengus]